MTRLERAKQKSIKIVLSQLGYTPEYETGTIIAYKSMLPGRYENEASLFIRKSDNTCVDYGSKEKRMDVVNLISIYKGISTKEAMDFLLSDEIQRDAIFIPPPPRDKPSVIVEDIRDIISPSVYEYLSERKISPHIARSNVSEVDFSFPYGKNPARIYTGIGFKNDSGGWDLRNGFFKIAVAPKNITTIKGTVDAYMLFEGFMNYLSALELSGVTSFKRTVIVLNSASFAGSIAPFLTGKRVHAYSDNDPTGTKVVQTLIEAGVDVVDERDNYSEYNDLNDKLTDKKLKINLEIKQ